MTSPNWLPITQAWFPSLNEGNCQLTSPVDEGYNCIAWAAEDTDRWWWPDPWQLGFWPGGAPREETVEAFVAMFGLLGYAKCPDASAEASKQKVAIFVDQQGKPTHAARQLSDGRWTSKLGPDVDIAHELAALEGGRYGRVAVVLARPKMLSGQAVEPARCTS
jgi:hypothetical protein